MGQSRVQWGREWGATGRDGNSRAGVRVPRQGGCTLGTPACGCRGCGCTRGAGARVPWARVPADPWEVPFEEILDLQWVGSGAQGAVFLGRFHGEEVAVKKVRDLKETDIKHLRKLKHPNIITFK